MLRKNKKVFALILFQLLIFSFIQMSFANTKTVFAKSIILNGENKKEEVKNTKEDKNSKTCKVTITMPKDKDDFYDDTELFIYDISNIYEDSKDALKKLSVSDYIKDLLKKSNRDYTKNKYLSIETKNGIAKVDLDFDKAYYIIDSKDYIRESIIIPFLEFGNNEETNIFPKLKGYYSEYEPKKPKDEPPKTPKTPPTPNVEVPNIPNYPNPEPVPKYDTPETPTPKEKVKTGDENNGKYLAQAFIASASILAIFMVLAKKKKSKEEN